MGADYPIPMVLLLFICLFGITTCSKGASFTIETNKFVEILTGKSLSEALIFASIKPQYDNRLFIELP